MSHEPIVPQLLKVKDYRSFLRLVYSHLKETQPHFSYGTFALKAGFSSRNYLRDIIAGQKRVTVAAFPKICRGLKIKGELKTYLSLMAALEERPLNFDSLSEIELRKKLAQSKVRLNKTVIEKPSPVTVDFYQMENWLPIYAALGSEESGATIDAIQSRTKLTRSKCLADLNLMVQKGVVKFKSEEQTYHPGPLHYVFNTLGEDEFFKAAFIKSAQRALKSANSNFTKADRLFFSSTFSIDSKKLTDFRLQLRELLLDFVASAESSEGDAIAEVSLCFLPRE